MRIWHQKLISKLCRQHLLAVWREGLGCYKIVCNPEIKGYRKHPAVKEFEYSPMILMERLELIRDEMISRGYHPKSLPGYPPAGIPWYDGGYIGKHGYKPWQSYNKQLQLLKSKNCDCKI